ncbi:hypothetical protein BDV96DRAFT_644921 [Lophiotrema nucula]|uniref:NmrA-like domain-containing protein n=1 Tax=Lophiotrema nucula TaxID=690887 RepID=A0A6A5ZB82_9PLEO|nr:hypothetical protein BDV96DRAFT_644921 [Lophiotrema nucula]
MAKHRVLLIGATGETGGDILSGLVEDGSFDISLLIRPSSTNTPKAKALEAHGFPFVVSDLTEPVDQLVTKIKGIDTIISAIRSQEALSEIILVEAAAKAGTKRFLPCDFGPVCPPGGIMAVRDTKEIVHNAILVAKLPYTFVDIGFWHQFSFPPVPSGKLDYAILFPGTNVIYGDGNAEGILTDKRDLGRFVARIIKDERTINKKVVAIADALTQNQIWEIVERLSGEKMNRTYVSADEVVSQLARAKEAAVASGNEKVNLEVIAGSYNWSRYVRADNSPENAKYLGYLDSRELYPDFRPIGFEEFMREALQGKAKKLYADGKVEKLYNDGKR